MRVRLSSPYMPYLSRLADALMLIAAAWIATLFHPEIGHFETNPFITERYLLLTSAGAFMHMVYVGNLHKSWRGENFINMLIGVIKHWFLVAIVLLISLYVLKSGSEFSRLWFGLWIVIGAVMISLERVVLHYFLRNLRSQGRNTKAVSIIGDLETANKVKEQIQTSGWSGYRIVNIINDIDADQAEKLKGMDEIWIVIPVNESERIKSVLHQIRHHAVVKRIVPDVFTLSLMRSGISNVVGVAMLDLINSPFNGEQRLIKLCEDKILALCILLMISPLMLMLAIGIKLTSPGPVFFTQQRLGLNNRPFRLYKFRSMKLHRNTDGIVHQATQHDQRITAFGSFLRRTSLDELPQFINVLLGDMSIVGPRPHAIEHNEHYKDLVFEYMHRHLVKPGITGWAQINGYRGETDQIYKMQKRVEYDMHYIQSWSLMLDLKIIFMTVFKGFWGKNAY